MSGLPLESLCFSPYLHEVILKWPFLLMDVSDVCCCSAPFQVENGSKSLLFLLALFHQSMPQELLERILECHACPHAGCFKSVAPSPRWKRLAISNLGQRFPIGQ